MRGVAVVVVGQLLGARVQEPAAAAVPGEVPGLLQRGPGRGVALGQLLVLTAAPFAAAAAAPAAGEGVELGVADVGESGGGARVVAGLGPPGRGEGAGRGAADALRAADAAAAAATTAGRGARAPRAAAAAEGGGAPRGAGGGAVVRVVQGGAGGRAARLVVGGGADVVVAVGGVLWGGGGGHGLAWGSGLIGSRTPNSGSANASRCVDVHTDTRT